MYVSPIFPVCISQQLGLKATSPYGTLCRNDALVTPQTVRLLRHDPVFPDLSKTLANHTVTCESSPVPLREILSRSLHTVCQASLCSPKIDCISGVVDPVQASVPVQQADGTNLHVAALHQANYSVVAGRVFAGEAPRVCQGHVHSVRSKLTVR